MLRNIVAAISAGVVGFVVISAIQGLNSLLFPLPAGTDLSDPAVAREVLARLPAGAYVGLELSYALGSLCVGLVLGRFAAGRHTLLALLLGALLTVANIANLVSLPHPLWLAVLTTVTFIPMTLLGRRLLGPRARGQGDM